MFNVHAAQDDVLQPGCVRIEAERNIEQGRNLARGIDLSARRKVDSRENPQQRGLARAVGPDQTDAIAILDIEVDVVQRSHVDAMGGVASEIALRGGRHQQLLERAAAALVDRELDRQIAQTKECHP
jgi:hypothetical protein